MFAVIQSGGRQFRVEKDAELKVDLLKAEPGSTVEFKHVLLVHDGAMTTVGQPMVKGAVVKGEVLRHMRDRKVLVFHKIPKGGVRKIRGHRQPYTVVKIREIMEVSHGS